MVLTGAFMKDSPPDAEPQKNHLGNFYPEDRVDDRVRAQRAVAGKEASRPARAKRPATSFGERESDTGK